MPIIPDDLNVSIPQGRRPVTRINTTSVAEATMDAARLRGQGGQALASGLASQAQSFQRAQDAVDETDYLQAKGKFLTAKVEQDNAYDQDPEWGTYVSRYNENMGRVRSDLMKGIKNPKYRQQFELETNAQLAEGQANLKSKAFDRETRDGVDSLNISINDGMGAALKARDEATRATIIAGINARIDAAQRANYISEPASRDLKKKFAENYAKQSIGLLPPSEQIAVLVPGAKPSAIQQQAIPGDYQARVAQIESGGNNKAVNPKSGAFGKYQWLAKTAAQYGITKDSSEKEEDAAFAKFTADNRNALRASLGRDPTDAELYLAHQQGASGAAALISNPEQPAIVALTGVYGNVEDARAAIINNGGSENMTAGQFTQLWSQKYNGGNTQVIGQVLNGDVPPGGWDFSQPTGTFADYLDPVTRAEMIDNATKAMKEESKAVREAAQIAVVLGADDANQNGYLTGKEDTSWSAKVMAAYPDERGAKMVAEYRKNVQAGADNNLIKNQSLTEDVAMLAGAEAAAMEPGPGSAAAAQRYGQLATAIKQKHEALKKDPAQYVIDNDPGAADAYAQIQNLDPQDPESVMRARLAAETILSAQRNMGLDDSQTHILPGTAATSIAAMIEPKEGQSGEEAVANIQAQAEQWGPYWPKVWSEIAGNVGDAGRMVAVMDPSQKLAAAKLIEANQQKDVLEKQTQGEVGTQIKEAVAGEFGDFMETFAHSGAIGEGLRYQQQAEILARRYVVEGATPQDAAARAYQETIGTVYDTSTGVRIPTRYDAEGVATGAEAVVRGLSDIDPVTDDLGAGPDTQNQYLSSIKANHRWVNSPDGLGLSLLDMYDRPVLKGGKPLTVSFDDLVGAKTIRLISRGMGQQ